MTNTLSQRTEGERLSDFLSSTFYSIRSQKFHLIGLHVDQQNNGTYKIEFVLEGTTEKEIES